MSDITPTSGSSVSGFLFGFLILFTILYSMWYFSGGPQKKDSNKAFIKAPTYQNPNTFDQKYGTVNEIDRVNRQINPQ